MAKRFIDTEMYRKEFYRSLSASYKLLWQYVLCNCDIAGVWYVELDIAQVYLGADVRITREEALKVFNADKTRIYAFDNGKRWFVIDFIEFQYGNLRRTNSLHRGVIKKLEEYGIQELIKIDEGVSEGLRSPYEGLKVKDKDKDNNIKLEIKEEIESDSNLLPDEPNTESAKMPKHNNDDIREVFNLFCELCPDLPRPRDLTQKRVVGTRNRLNELGGIDGVRKMLEIVGKSQFLNGDNNHGWTATYDWLFCAKGNWVKVMEGNYNHTTNANHTNTGLQIGQVVNDGQSESILRKANF